LSLGWRRRWGWGEDVLQVRKRKWGEGENVPKEEIEPGKG